MNSRIILSLAFVISFSIVSCKKELKPQDSADPADTTAVIAPAVVPEGQAMQTPPPPPPTQATQTVQAPVAKTAPGMNPPHGQPNHRCDIAVGAPLNSPPGKKPAAPQPPAVTPGKASVEKISTAPPSALSPALPAATATTTAPGMNPPHGQPNHRCDIAVGAPLPK